MIQRLTTIYVIAYYVLNALESVNSFREYIERRQQLAKIVFVWYAVYKCYITVCSCEWHIFQICMQICCCLCCLFFRIVYLVVMLSILYLLPTGSFFVSLIFQGVELKGLVLVNLVNFICWVYILFYFIYLGNRVNDHLQCIHCT